MKRFLSLIKVEHTLFALPLALTGAVMGAKGMPDWRILLLVAIAFTAARASAMAFNRLVDRRLDALNPRTADRELPTGKVTAKATGLFIILSVVIFIGASWAINPLCGTLAPVALLIILGYSYTKRFTLLCHYLLGLALGIAPVAGWLAVTGHFGWPPIILGLGVIFWTGGFDIIYATQDMQFDQEMGLYSLPARFGVRLALGLAASSHLIAFGLFLLSGFLSNLGWSFYLFSLITGSLLIWEHRLVSPEDLSKLDLAFFRANSMVSVSLFLAVCAGLLA